MAQLTLRARANKAAASLPEKRTWLDHYHWVAATLAYTAITLVVLFPLVLHLGNGSIESPLRGDNGWEVWYLWWFRSAINSGQNPAYTHAMYALLPSITLFPAGYYDGAVGYVLQWAGLSPITAYNLLIVLGFILTGLTTYLLAGAFVQSRLASFVAGFLFSFSTYHFTRATGHLTLATLQWLPLCAWRTFAFYRRPTPRNAVWLGLSSALVALTEIYYVAYFLLPFGLLFVAGKLVTDFTWFRQRRHLLLAGLALGLAAVVAVPPLSSFLVVDPATRQALQLYAQTGTDVYSADLLAYFLPFAQSAFFRTLTLHMYQSMHTDSIIEEDAYLGVVTLLLAASALFFRRNRQRRSAWFWLATGVFAMVLSLGPVWYVGGHRIVSLPAYNLLYGLPLLSPFRAPNRISPLTLLSFAMLAAYAIDAIEARLVFDRLTRVAMIYLFVVAVGASLMENIIVSWPLPVVQTVVPAFYQQIAADPDPNALVLDVPLGSRGSDEFYQTIHHKRLVGGYPVRATAPEQLSVESVPYLTFFEPGSLAHPLAPYTSMQGGFAGALAEGDIYPIQETFAQALQVNHIKYVVLHRLGTPKAQYVVLRRFLLKQLGAPLFDNSAVDVPGQGNGAVDRLAAWRVAPSTIVPRIDRFRFGDGWLPGLRVAGGHLERAMEQDAHFDIASPKAGPQRVIFQADAYYRPLTLQVSLNGQLLGTFRIAQPWSLQTIDLGMAVLQQGNNTLVLHAVEGCTLPRVFDPTDLDSRCFSFGIEHLQIVLGAPSA